MLRRVSKPLAGLIVLLISLSAWAGEGYWIDVRSEREFESGHVDGAVNIPYTEIADRIAEVTEDKDARLYLYCRSGRRSAIAADALADLGFSDVTDVGGFREALEKAKQLEAQ